MELPGCRSWENSRGKGGEIAEPQPSSQGSGGGGDDGSGDYYVTVVVFKISTHLAFSTGEKLGQNFGEVVDDVDADVGHSHSRKTE